MKSYLIKLGLYALVTMLFVIGCKRENNSILNQSDKNIDTVAQQQFVITTAPIYGTVTDKNNNPIVGAIIKYGNKTVVTNAKGVFTAFKTRSIDNVTLITCTKIGYFDAFLNIYNDNDVCRIILSENANSNSIDATQGGKVTIANGAEIIIPANSVIVNGGGIYSGTVTIASNYINPTDTDFYKQIPGGDLRGIDVQNKQVVLYSYGMLQVELKGSNGEKLNIAPGKKATLSFPIQPSMQVTAPAEIPLWYFDEVKGIWVEEGKAQKNGAVYTGAVAHFTTWNVDVPFQSVIIKGKVVDCKGKGLKNFGVKIGQSIVYTSYNGEYSSFATANNNITINVTYKYSLLDTLRVVEKQISTTSSGLTHIVDPLIIPCRTKDIKVVGELGEIDPNNVLPGDAPPPPPPVPTISGRVLYEDGQPFDGFAAILGDHIVIEKVDIVNGNFTLPNKDSYFNIKSFYLGIFSKKGVCVKEYYIYGNTAYDSLKIIVKNTNTIAFNFSIQINDTPAVINNISSIVAYTYIDPKFNTKEIITPEKNWVDLKLNIALSNFSKGVYKPSQNSYFYIEIWLNGFYKIKNDNSAIVTITQYDGDNGLIKGTFSGNFSKQGTTQNFNISGSFEAFCTPAQPL